MTVAMGTTSTVGTTSAAGAQSAGSPTKHDPIPSARALRGPLVYTTAIASDWIDYNGHLRDAYYSLVLSYACDALMDRLGLDNQYRRATCCTLYTLEQHLHFLHEVLHSDQLELSVRLLGSDRKRLHVGFDFYCARYNTPVAVGELMLLHVRQGGRPAAETFPPSIITAIEALRTETMELAAPGFESRRIELRR